MVKAIDKSLIEQSAIDATKGSKAALYDTQLLAVKSGKNAGLQEVDACAARFLQVLKFDNVDPQTKKTALQWFAEAATNSCRGIRIVQNEQLFAMLIAGHEQASTLPKNNPARVMLDNLVDDARRARNAKSMPDPVPFAIKPPLEKMEVKPEPPQASVGMIKKM